jgi:competence protein ComEC
MVALLTNILVVPVVPLVMLGGLITGMIGILVPPLGTFFGALTWVPLEYTIRVSEFFASLPFAAVNFPRMSLPLMLLVYVMLIIVIMKYRSTRNNAFKF